MRKNTKGTDQLKGTLKDLRENIDFNRCPLENMHSTTLKQLYLAKFTKLRRVVSMSWITEQKQTEVNKENYQISMESLHTFKNGRVLLLILDGMKE